MNAAVKINAKLKLGPNCWKVNLILKMHVHVFGAHIQMCHKFNKFLKIYVHVFSADIQSCDKLNLIIQMCHKFN